MIKIIPIKNIMDKKKTIEIYRQKLKGLKDDLLAELEKLKLIILDEKRSKNDIKKAVEKAEKLISRFRWIITEAELRIAKNVEKKSIENDEEFLDKLDKIIDSM